MFGGITPLLRRWNPQFLMKYLATFDGAPPRELKEVKPEAVRGCIGAVKAPIVSFTEQV